MSLRRLRLLNFRSYATADFALHPKLTFVVGPNGSGKTNLLESLYVAATTKSWRATERTLTKHGQAGWELSAQLSDFRLSMAYTARGSKLIKLNNRRTRAENYIGRLPVVLFEPGSLAIVTGAPEARRRYLNGILASSNRLYLRHLLSYRRILRQRNALLRSGQPVAIKQQLFAWDIKLAEHGSFLVKQRQRVVGLLGQLANDLYNQIAGQSVELSFQYQSSVHTDDYATALLAALEQAQARDMLLGHTTVGPHRDDLAIKFNNRPVNNLASRGELRSVTLACKLTELAYINDHNRNPAILLLDDVLSELDKNRQRYLLEHLGNTQTVITTTDLSRLKSKLARAHSVIKL